MESTENTPKRTRMSATGARGVIGVAPPATPRTLRAARRHPRLLGDLPARRGCGAQGRRVGGPWLRHQLVLDPRPRVLLRGRRATVFAAAPLVSGRGGAVLPGVAGRARRRSELRGFAPAVEAYADGRALRGGGVGGCHGRTVRARCRPVADLLRYRHAGDGAAVWRGPRLPAIAD